MPLLMIFYVTNADICTTNNKKVKRQIGHFLEQRLGRTHHNQKYPAHLPLRYLFIEHLHLMLIVSFASALAQNLLSLPHLQDFLHFFTKRSLFHLVVDAVQLI
jgi:hypothetical protein